MSTILTGPNFMELIFPSGIRLVLRWQCRSPRCNIDDMVKTTRSCPQFEPTGPYGMSERVADKDLDFYAGDHLEFMMLTPDGEQVELDRHDSCRQVGVEEIASLMAFAATPQDLPTRLKIFAGGYRPTLTWRKD